MKNFKLFTVFALSMILLSFSSKKDCSILKNNTFKYTNKGKEVIVVFDGDEHTEYHDNKKYFIKSEIVWISDCEYNLFIDETTLPNFPLKADTKLHVKVTRVKGDKVYYKCSSRTRTWKGKLTKIKK